MNQSLLCNLSRLKYDLEPVPMLTQYVRISSMEME
jgi:hypothetical protein